MAQQTAMQEIIKWLECGWKDEDVDVVINKCKQLLKKEKEQIIDAATWGFLAETGEQYYNEKYKK